MKRFIPTTLLTAAGAVVLLAAGCTIKNQEVPPLAGPSEFGTSVVLTASPDELTQDGFSQSLVTITARGPNGEPLRNVSVRSEIQFGGFATDFGSLSARNLVTGADGRATLVYTAPSSPAGPAVNNFSVVTIAVWPVGTNDNTPLVGNFDNATPRIVSIRLVPPGVVAPPDRLNPRFTVTPSAPVDHDTVFFDASGSTSLPTAPITEYRWNFGDGQTGTGKTITHSFSQAGTFLVALTLVDSFSRTATTTQVVTVSAGTSPSASFVASPNNPQVLQTVNFNAAASTAAAGRRIVSYSWSFGDGETRIRTDSATTHGYATAGTFTVTLTVTDDAGRTATVSQSISVGTDAPTASFTVSPTTPIRGTPVSFNASGSAATQGRTITSYAWNFGDPDPSSNTATGQTALHTYATAGTYVVTLIVTDSAGKTGRVTLTVTVQ